MRIEVLGKFKTLSKAGRRVLRARAALQCRDYEVALAHVDEALGLLSKVVDAPGDAPNRGRAADFVDAALEDLNRSAAIFNRAVSAQCRRDLDEVARLSRELDDVARSAACGLQAARVRIERTVRRRHNER